MLYVNCGVRWGISWLLLSGFCVAEIRFSVVFQRVSQLYAVLFKVQISLQCQERVNHRLYDPRITTSDPW